MVGLAKRSTHPTNPSGNYRVRHAVAGNQFPLIHPAMSVYVALTDGLGAIEIRLRLIDVDDANDPIFDNRNTVTFADPRVIGELEFSQMNVAFPVPGEYRLQLYANDEFLLERRLHAIHLEAGPGPTPGMN
jgi:hypothetical protein